MSRILPKPDVYKPSTREEEHSSWIQWYWSLKQYLCALDAGFSSELSFIENNPTVVIGAVASAESEQRSKQLYSLLASLVKGRGLQVVQRTPLQHGFEALRQLIQLFQPSSRTRSLGILSALTSMNQFRAGEPLLPQVLDMERIIDEYERSSGKKLDDDFKSSIFLKSLSGNMRNHLATILTEDVTYDTLRESALRFERMNTRWDHKNLFQGDSLFASKSRGNEQQPVPMEVDAMLRKGPKGGKPKGGKPKGKGGKDKGKSKGSGKGGQGGKPKGPSKGKPSAPKGKGQQGSGSWGSQVGSWGSQAGSWSSQQNVVCHTCGKKGHIARDCWRNVQQVQSQGQLESSTASTVAPSSLGPSASQLAPASASRHVNRVEIDMTALLHQSPMPSSDSTEHCLRAVQRCDLPDSDFLDVVRSLHRIPGYEPPLPNLVPVAVEVPMPHVPHFDMSYSDEDTAWTFCDVDDCLKVHAVQWDADATPCGQDIQVVVDSGSDASCLPLSWASVGTAADASDDSFRDAQGHPIHGSEMRTATLQIGDVCFKERWLVSSVTQPLFSVGKLLRQGWNIIHDDDIVPHLTNPNGSVRVPLYYKHNSLLMPQARFVPSALTRGPQCVLLRSMMYGCSFQGTLSS